jgi:hypothetical protein
MWRRLRKAIFDDVQFQSALLPGLISCLSTTLLRGRSCLLASEGFSCTAVAACDAASGPHLILIGLLIAGPCCALLTARWLPTVLASLYALALGIVRGSPTRSTPPRPSTPSWLPSRSPALPRRRAQPSCSVIEPAAERYAGREQPLGAQRRRRGKFLEPGGVEGRCDLRGGGSPRSPAPCSVTSPATCSPRASSWRSGWLYGRSR